MGRGLGKTQQAILDYLRERGSEVYVSTLTSVLYEEQTGVRELDPVPRAFAVSIRRAIHALTERGLIGCGNSPAWGLGTRSNPRLLCWLPEHGTQTTQPTIRGADVDQLVLAALKEADEDRSVGSFVYGRLPGMSDEEWPLYNWLTREVTAKIENHTGDYKLYIDGASAVAIHRSVNRLAQQGKIRIYNQSHNRIGWVKLSQHVSVAK